ncbi:MAG: CDP-glycerol glycerophosphotransferase family protein, partial [Marmoricola sp.]
MRGATRARRAAVHVARGAARRSGGRWSVPGLLTVVLTTGEGSDHLEESLGAALGQGHQRLEVLVAGVGDDPVLPRGPRDGRVRLLGRHADLAQARAAGLDAAAGRFVAFLDADHLPTHHGWSQAVASLRSTGSTVALLAHRTHRRGRVFDADDWVRWVHGEPARGVTCADRPRLLADMEAAAAVFDTAALRAALAPVRDDLGHDATLLAAALRPATVDVLSAVGVHLRAAGDRTGPARVPLDGGGLTLHIAALERAHALLSSSEPVAAWHTGLGLGRLLPPALDVLWHEPELSAAAATALERLVPLAGAAYASAVPAQQKGLHHLLLHEPERARTFLGAVRPSARRHPTRLAEAGAGAPDAVLLDLEEPWTGLPAVARVLAEVETQARVEVTRLDLTAGEGVVEGWAFVDALDPAGPPTTAVTWIRDDGRRVPLEVEVVPAPRADRLSDLVWADVTPTGFRGRFRPTDLGAGTWTLEAVVAERGVRRQARAVVRPWTMAGMPVRGDAARRRLVVDHDDLHQLQLVVREDGFRVGVEDDGSGLRLAVQGAGLRTLALRPRGGGAAIRVAARRTPAGLAAEIDPASLDPAGSPYALEVGTSAGPTVADIAVDGATACSWTARRGGLLLGAPAASAQVLAARLEPEELVAVLGLPAGVSRWRTALVQGVTETPGSLRSLGDGRHEARYRLVRPHGEAVLALPSGDHVLCTANDALPGWTRARPAPDVLLGAEELQPRMRLRVEAFSPDLPAVRLVVSPPLTDHELGERHQRLLREATHVDAADRGSVFFRAMFGEHTSGNGLGVHEELRRRGSHLALLWAVADLSVPVPAGGVGVVERSRDWHEAIARSRYHMVDVHQVEWFRRPEGQTLIQTMHGYPYKLMGHAWWRRMGNSVQEIASLDRRTRDWSVLVSPATYATPLLRAAFLAPASAGAVPVLETGYPRNDVLLRPEAAAVRARTRAALGIAGDQRVVLYAPTFRDYLSAEDRTARAVTFFDVEEALAALPEQYVVLRRGHAFNARVRDDRLRASARFRDVTDHPDVNDLILASDVGVLDYSSLRFDYVLSGNPMVFLVPDLEEYDRHRGGVIPYGPTAPGPWTSSTAETVAWLTDLDRLRNEYAAARAVFRADYVDLEDGRAA